MNTDPGMPLAELLRAPEPDVVQIIAAFVSRWNASCGHPAMDCWEISKEDWERYEFLGDRVLNLIVARSLFSQREPALDEGAMTLRLSATVSNRALDAVTKKYGNGAFACLIPRVIGEQKTYGERITGGAFEAFAGALYCEEGFEAVEAFVLALLGDPATLPNPDENAIGALQEYFQKKTGAVPVYRQKARTGPDHRPEFTYEVLSGGEILGEGRGESIRQAQQAAARMALDRIRNRDNCSGST